MSYLVSWSTTRNRSRVEGVAKRLEASRYACHTAPHHIILHPTTQNPPHHSLATIDKQERDGGLDKSE